MLKFNNRIFPIEKQKIVAQITSQKIAQIMKLLEPLKVNSNITQVELSNKNVSRRTISTLLVNLKEKGKIERVGSDRKGYWKILQ